MTMSIQWTISMVDPYSPLPPLQPYQAFNPKKSPNRQFLIFLCRRFILIITINKFWLAKVKVQQFLAIFGQTRFLPDFWVPHYITGRVIIISLWFNKIMLSFKTLNIERHNFESIMNLFTQGFRHEQDLQWSNEKNMLSCKHWNLQHKNQNAEQIKPQLKQKCTPVGI